MPLAKFYLPAALSDAKVRSLSNAVHHALVETCNVPDADRFQLIWRFDPRDMDINPTFPNVERSAEACIVEILFIEGRKVEQKAALFRSICDQAVAAGFRGDDLMITVTENARTDWSAGNGEIFQ